MQKPETESNIMAGVSFLFCNQESHVGSSPPHPKNKKPTNQNSAVDTTSKMVHLVH